MDAAVCMLGIFVMFFLSLMAKNLKDIKNEVIKHRMLYSNQIIKGMWKEIEPQLEAATTAEEVRAIKADMIDKINIDIHQKGVYKNIYRISESVENGE